MLSIWYSNKIRLIHCQCFWYIINNSPALLISFPIWSVLMHLIYAIIDCNFPLSAICFCLQIFTWRFLKILEDYMAFCWPWHLCQFGCYKLHWIVLYAHNLSTPCILNYNIAIMYTNQHIMIFNSKCIAAHPAEYCYNLKISVDDSDDSKSVFESYLV